MNRETRLGLLIGVLVILLIALCSCQTIRGFAADTGRQCEDIKHQIPAQQE